ncbi:DUF805 domain-containing protein [Ferrovibrio sp.]|uniref:DUF805 domain-containing protein n=1 Tax=Ferrovibrio sp. TaxID=1917215 RepID=UPI003D0D22F7
MSIPVFSGIFRFSGRRNRKSYFLYLVTLLVTFLVCSALFGSYLERLKYLNEERHTQLSILFAIIFLILLVSAGITAAQRCRDFGWTGWSALIVALPFIGWVFALAILFIPGNVGPNRYGPDPLQPQESKDSP